MVHKSLKINGSKILDVGCGAGLTILKFLQKGYFVYGVDLSPNMIVQARAMATKSSYENFCELWSGDIERLPYPNDFFDAIVWMGV